MILDKKEHSWKQEPSITVIKFDIMADDNEEQPLKHIRPTVITEFGMFMDDKDEHFSKQ